MLWRWCAVWVVQFSVLCAWGQAGEAAAEDGNLVMNPSFEVPALEYAALYWQPFMTEFPFVTKDRAHTGDHSLELYLQEEGNHTNGDWRGVGQFILLNQTQVTELELSCWARGYRLNHPARVFVDLEYSDGTIDRDKTLVFSTGSFHWQQRRMMLSPVKPVTSVYLYIILTGQALASAWFDDVRLVELPLPATMAAVTTRASFRPGLELVQWCKECQYQVVHRFLQATEGRKGNYDVTIVTQLSADRMDRLCMLADKYRGPISAALYIRSHADVAAAESAWNDAGCAALREHVDVHLVFSRPGRLYPVNALRNVAWEGARTDHLLLLDVDFMPSNSLRTTLQAYLQRLYDISSLGNAAFVVPAFETVGQQAWPGSREQLTDMVDRGAALPVHILKFAAAHGPTNYEKWYTSKGAYEVDFDLMYEPYVVIPRTAPRYDERFVGYGNDKVSHAYELFLARFRFVVLPNVFLIHMEHPPPQWLFERNMTRVWVNWYSFAYGAEARYGQHKMSIKAGGINGAPREGCTDTCKFARDKQCDDGGPGATSAYCLLGSDCADCGDRTALLRRQRPHEQRVVAAPAEAALQHSAGLQAELTQALQQNAALKHTVLEQRSRVADLIAQVTRARAQRDAALLSLVELREQLERAEGTLA